MDTFYCSNWCLIWIIVTIFLNQLYQVSGSHRECPQGQLLHSRLSDGAVCCYPIRCGVGQHVVPCTTNGTQDICKKCPKDQTQFNRTSSFTMEECEVWDLGQNCGINDNWNRDTWVEKSKHCMCNVELGKRFEPPQSASMGVDHDSYCQRRSDQCGPGKEPHVDGGCVPCQENYFQSNLGFFLCEPKTNCTLLGLEYVYYSRSDATADNNCSHPDPVSTTKLVARVTEAPTPLVIPPETKIAISKQPSSTDPSTTASQTPVVFDISKESEDTAESDSSHIWPIVLSTVFLVALVVAIGVVMFWCRRKGKSVCFCAAFKDCFDLEKSGAPESVSQPGNQQSRQVTSNGCTSSSDQSLFSGNKITNNNIMDSTPNGHPNGSIPHVHFHKASENGNGNLADSCQSSSLPSSRPGILRNARQALFQRRGNESNMSHKITSQERLQVHVDEFEANPNTSEYDQLLVLEQTHRTLPQQHQAAVGYNSPLVIQAGVNFLPFNSPVRTSFDSVFAAGEMSPAYAQLGSPTNPRDTVKFTRSTSLAAPTNPADTVKFTRSTSVIASPEGEVDDEDRQVHMPRFSQLLQDDEETPLPDSDPIPSHKNPVASQSDIPGRRVTHQPQQHPTSNHNKATNHQQRFQANLRSGAPVKPPGHQTDQASHLIMDLKEQQLTDSIPSPTLTTPLSDTQLKTASDHTEIVPETAACEKVQQTEPKTLSPSTEDADTSAFTGVKSVAAQNEVGATPDPESDGIFQNLAERRRNVSGGSVNQNEKRCFIAKNNFKILDKRQHVGCGSSNQSLHDHHHQALEDSQQRLCFKSPSSEDHIHLHTNQPVLLKGHESSPTSGKQQGRHPRHSVQSQSSSEKTDTEQNNVGSHRNNVSQKCSTSSCSISSKSSVNSDHNDTRSNSNSPSRNTLYTRSQSQTASGGSESSHKLPPRSMSEEKPQKLDRPVAKVKPMPAGDITVNQLSRDMEETAPPVQTAAAIHSSDDSGRELGLNIDHTQTSCGAEEERIVEAEAELEESGV